MLGCSVLPSTVFANLSTDAVTSPNYPSNYEHDLECTWSIQVASGLVGHIVKVTFNNWQLGHYSGDELRFYDGSSNASNILGFYCRTVHPEVLYSTGQHLYVKFYTDQRNTDKGFGLSISAVAKGNLFTIFSGYFSPSKSPS